MTFEITSPSLFQEVTADRPCPVGQSRSIAHVEPLKTKTQISQQHPKEARHEKIEKQHWKNESRTDSDSISRDLKSRGVASGHVETHLNLASECFKHNDIAGAVGELKSALIRVKKHNEMVRSSLNKAISYLTTIGGESAAPHPYALSLIRARKTYLE